MEELIESLNPWWMGEEDPALARWRALRFKVVPNWIRKLSLDPFSLNFVVGPRQVGKTTGIKLLIRELLNPNSINPASILYLNCEIFPSFRDLLDILRWYLEFRRRKGAGHSYIFLDEVTSLEGWWRPIKVLVDSGDLLGDVIVATGSSSIKVRRDADFFPGRRGAGRTVEVIPLSFREYARMMGADTDSQVRRAFQEYLEVGGFLSKMNGMPDAELISGYLNEMVRFGKSLEIVKEIVASLFRKAPSAVSYRSLAADTSGYSYKVVQTYLEFLKDLYLVGIAYLKDDGVKYRKERKFFFRDPALARVFSQWADQKFLESALYEWVVQEHVYREYGRVFYYRNGYEIDVVADGLKVEVKAGKPHRRYPKGVILLDESNIWKFLLDLGGDLWIGGGEEPGPIDFDGLL